MLAITIPALWRGEKNLGVDFTAEFCAREKMGSVRMGRFVIPLPLARNEVSLVFDFRGGVFADMIPSVHLDEVSRRLGGFSRQTSVSTTPGSHVEGDR
jgi:hypothetical protein